MTVMTPSSGVGTVAGRSNAPPPGSGWPGASRAYTDPASGPGSGCGLDTRPWARTCFGLRLDIDVVRHEQAAL